MNKESKSKPWRVLKEFRLSSSKVEQAFGTGRKWGGIM